MYFYLEVVTKEGHAVNSQPRVRAWRRTGEIHLGQDKIPKDVGCLPEDAECDHDASGGKEAEVEGAPEGHQHHGHHCCRLLPW